MLMGKYCVQRRAKMALKHMEGFKVGMAGPEESKWKSEEQKHSAKKGNQRTRVRTEV